MGQVVVPGQVVNVARLVSGLGINLEFDELGTTVASTYADAVLGISLVGQSVADNMGGRREHEQRSLSPMVYSAG